MKLRFESKQIPSRSIKINGRIKNVIGQYRKLRVPMKALMTDYLAVKSMGDILVDADNPWAYYYKGVEGHEIESGVSVEETAFRFAAMKLKDQIPTDVINAAYFANKYRNDSDFELGYLLPLFLENIKENDTILIENPSPDIICAFEEHDHKGKHFYSVTDRTIARLYALQFPSAKFYTIDTIRDINERIDAVLIINRDQRQKQSDLLKCLPLCSGKALVLGLVPNVWFDDPHLDTYSGMEAAGFGISQILIVDTHATSSTPRKKMIVHLEKGCRENIEVKQSTYDMSSRVFRIHDGTVSVSVEEYQRSEKTILYFCRKASALDEKKTEAKYKKAKEYSFSREISLFYNVYEGRKHRYAGVAYYKEIKDVSLKKWGRKLSGNVEKGLRAKSKKEVVDALKDIIFDDALYSIIRADLEKKYILERRSVSLKTVWFYCWCFMNELRKYDHEYLVRLFQYRPMADLIPEQQTGRDLLEAIAGGLETDADSIPYKAIEQVDLVLKTAVQHRVLFFDPLETYVAEYTSRASQRQQDVRNALVKKHFSSDEEYAIFRHIIRKKHTDGKLVRCCTERSILLATAIRMFTGLSIREVAALDWSDYKMISGSDLFQLTISKFVDTEGRILLHSTRENWKRFRVVPVARVLAYLLNERKQYLLEKGIRMEHLQTCPIILQNELSEDMKKGKRIRHCKPAKISLSGNELILEANIPPNEVILPDEKNDLITDFNRYHGDIFQSNFRHKANHEGYLTIGEINYMIGVNAPDTFSQYYCDYTNDFLQEAMIQKLCRWEHKYEILVTGGKRLDPARGEHQGCMTIHTGPFQNGVAAVDVYVDNHTGKDVNVTARSDHGMNVNYTEY